MLTQAQNGITSRTSGSSSNWMRFPPGSVGILDCTSRLDSALGGCAQHNVRVRERAGSTGYRARSRWQRCYCIRVGPQPREQIPQSQHELPGGQHTKPVQQAWGHIWTASDEGFPFPSTVEPPRSVPRSAGSVVYTPSCRALGIRSQNPQAHREQPSGRDAQI